MNDHAIEGLTDSEAEAFWDAIRGIPDQGCWWHVKPRLHDCGSCRDAVTE